MTKEEFLQLSEGDQAAEIIANGRHLGRQKIKGKTLNLYLLDDLFVEILFNPYNNHIESIALIEDLSVIDQYLDEYILRKGFREDP